MASGNRVSVAAGILRRQGVKAMALSASRELSRALGDTGAQAQEIPAVVAGCDFHLRGPYPQPSRLRGDPLVVEFVVPRYSAGAGGHANIFRVARQTADAGFSVRVAVTDTDAASLPPQQAMISPMTGPGVAIEAFATDAGRDILVATSWPTAYEAYAAKDPAVHKFYLVQDYEALFYPASSLGLLAATTYRFGFHTITLGSWLADVLRERHGVKAAVLDFGYDADVYHPGDGTLPRQGVLFYSRASTPRRCLELGLETLKLFSTERPDVPVIVFGSEPGAQIYPFPVADRGVLEPVQLAELYRGSLAALVLSATNLSLLPLELMACGVRTVVNDEIPMPAGVPSGGYLAVPGLPRALAQALESAVAAVAAVDVATATATETALAVADRGYGDLGSQFVAALRSKALA